MVYALLTQISLCNYGTNFYLRLKTLSTCSVLHVTTHLNQYIKSSTRSTISILNYEHHLDAEPLYINIHNLIYHGTQEELMPGTPDQQNIPINVTAYISWTPRNIESAKVSHFYQSSVPSQRSIHWLQISEKLLVEIIKLNKGKTSKPSKHLQALEDLSNRFKD